VSPVSEWPAIVPWVQASALAACLGFGAGGLVRPAAAAEGVADLVPADVELAVIIDDLATTSAAWSKTRWGSLFSGGIFAPLQRELEQADIAAPLHLRPWFGIDWNDLSSWNGSAAYVLFGNGRGEVQAAWIFLAPAAKQRELLAHAERYFAARRFELVEETVAESRIVFFRSPANQQRSREPAYFTNERCCGVATSRDAAAMLVGRMAQRDFRSLTKVPEYGATRQHEASTSGLDEIKFWVRPLELWKLLRSRDAVPANPDWLAIQARQGFESLRAVRGVVTFPASGPCEIELQGEIFLTRPLTKAARLLDLKPGKGMVLPPWVAEDFAVLSQWQCDAPGFVSSFGQLFDEVNEPGPEGQGLFEDIIDGLRDDPEGPRVDLRREVIAHLGPEMLSLADRVSPPPDANLAAQTRSLLAVQCRNPEAVTKGLQRFFAADNEVQHGKIGSHPLWTIGPGRSLFVEGAGKTFAPVRAVLVYEQVLLVASHPELVTRCFPPEKLSVPAAAVPLRNWSAWLATTSGPQTCVRNLVLEKSWLEAAYQAASNPQDTPAEDAPTNTLRFLLLGESSPTKEASLHQQLPSWQDLQTGLYSTGLTLDLTPTGFHMRCGVLRQPVSVP
jgi:hypothetical protein